MKRPSAIRTLQWLGVALVTAAIFFLAHTVNPAGVGILDRSLGRLLYPVEESVTFVLDGAGTLLQRYVLLVNTARENERLKDEVTRLRLENRRQTEVIRRLDSLVPSQEYSRQLRFETTPARIIGHNFEAASRMVTINRGSGDGVKEDQGVITPDGVVGVVVRVMPGAALVRLLIDPRTAVDAVEMDTRVRGIVKGRNDPRRLRCEFAFVEQAAKVNDRAKLETSGLDQRFPPGIPVGTVSFALTGHTDSEQQSFQVVSAVSFDTLEHVLVITGSSW